MDKSFGSYAYRYLIKRKIPCIIYYEDIFDFSNKIVISVMKEMCKQYPLVLCYKINWYETYNVKLNIDNHTSSDILSFKKNKITCRLKTLSKSELHNLFQTVYNDSVINCLTYYDNILIKEGKITEDYKHEKYDLNSPSYKISILRNVTLETNRRLTSCRLGHIPVKKYMEIFPQIDNTCITARDLIVSNDVVGYELKNILGYKSHIDNKFNSSNSFDKSINNNNYINYHENVFNNYHNKNSISYIDLNTNNKYIQLDKKEGKNQDTFNKTKKINNFIYKNGINNINIESNKSLYIRRENAETNQYTKSPSDYISHNNSVYYKLPSLKNETILNTENISHNILKNNIYTESNNIRKEFSPKEKMNILTPKSKLSLSNLQKDISLKNFSSPKTRRFKSLNDLDCVSNFKNIQSIESKSVSNIYHENSKITINKNNFNNDKNKFSTKNNSELQPSQTLDAQNIIFNNLNEALTKENNKDTKQLLSVISSRLNHEKDKDYSSIRNNSLIISKKEIKLGKTKKMFSNKDDFKFDITSKLDLYKRKLSVWDVNAKRSVTPVFSKRVRRNKNLSNDIDDRCMSPTLSFKGKN